MVGKFLKLFWALKWAILLVLALCLYGWLDRDLTYYKHLGVLILLNPISKLCCVGLVGFDWLLQMKDEPFKNSETKWFYKLVAKAMPSGFFWCSLYFIKFGLLSLFEVAPYHLPFDFKYHMALIIFTGQFIISQVLPMLEFVKDKFASINSDERLPQVMAANSESNQTLR